MSAAVPSPAGAGPVQRGVGRTRAPLGRRQALVAAAALATARLAQGEPHRHAEPATAGAPGATSARFRREMDAAMRRMMDAMHAPGYSGDPDIDFLAMMIPHHQGAIEMAKLVLDHGRDPATRRLAEDIIASQQVEIQGMQRRLALLRAGHGTEPFPELGGTRGARP